MSSHYLNKHTLFHLTNNTLHDILIWHFILQKQNGTTTYNALTFNGNVLGTATKYALVGTYNLTVIKLTASDEGTYRCIVGLKNYDMHLAVVGKNWLKNYLVKYMQPERKRIQ